MSKIKAEVVAFHGWGLDRSIWQWLKNDLGEFYRLKAADRGYFGSQNFADWSDTEPGIPKILVAHSYGLHWCSPELIEQADHLLLVSSFTRFHPPKKVEQEASRRLTESMITSFKRYPKEVIRDFFELACLPSGRLRFKHDFKHVDTDLLLKDLIDLDRDNHSYDTLFETESILIIHGKADQVVSIDLAHQMHQDLAPKSRMTEVENGDHMLPDTHSPIIADQIKSIVES